VWLLLSRVQTQSLHGSEDTPPLLLPQPEGTAASSLLCLALPAAACTPFLPRLGSFQLSAAASIFK
jgi:hypothetical protein